MDQTEGRTGSGGAGRKGRQQRQEAPHESCGCSTQAPGVAAPAVLTRPSHCPRAPPWAFLLMQNVHSPRARVTDCRPVCICSLRERDTFGPGGNGQKTPQHPRPAEKGLPPACARNAAFQAANCPSQSCRLNEVGHHMVDTGRPRRGVAPVTLHTWSAQRSWGWQTHDPPSPRWQRGLRGTRPRWQKRVTNS